MNTTTSQPAAATAPRPALKQPAFTTITVADAEAVAQKVYGNDKEWPLVDHNSYLSTARSVAQLIGVDKRNPANLTETEQAYANAWAEVGSAKGLWLSSRPGPLGEPVIIWTDAVPDVVVEPIVATPAEVAALQAAHQKEITELRAIQAAEVAALQPVALTGEPIESGLALTPAQITERQKLSDSLADAPVEERAKKLAEWDAKQRAPVAKSASPLSPNKVVAPKK